MLVNNAGIADQAVATVQQQIEPFSRLLAVHLNGCFLLSRITSYNVCYTKLLRRLLNPPAA